MHRYFAAILVTWGLRDYGVAGQIGLEATLDDWLKEMVAVFREVRRVLRKDGTLWLNIGDAYATSANGRSAADMKALGKDDRTFRDKPFSTVGDGIKAKDLLMMPARLALALQAGGWWLRSEIVWCLSGGAWLYARTQKGVGPAMLRDVARLDPATVELWTGERWTNVTAWTKREGRANAYEIVLRSGERVGCTAGHLWPTQRGNVRTNDLRKGDQIRTAKLPSGGQPAGWLNRDAFWFAGLYLAEGSRSGNTIQIAGHVRETARWERIQALAAHYGASARLYENGNSQNIHIDRAAGLNAILATLIGGKTAKDKHLTNLVWRYCDRSLKLLAEGYLEGDGHEDNSRIRLGFTRNYALERDLRCLAARLGATITLKPTFAKNKLGRFPSFRGEWRWCRSGHRNERDRGEIMEVRRSRARHFWDVAVADSSSLFALSSGVLSHNSKPNPMPESIRDRPTSAHEKIYLLTKSARYFYDAEAVRTAYVESSVQRLNQPTFETQTGGPKDVKEGNRSHRKVLENIHKREKKRGLTPRHEGHVNHTVLDETGAGMGANLRNVWTIATAPFNGARFLADLCNKVSIDHFATFPTALVEPCIKAGTSEKGCCPKCGSPWVRETTVSHETGGPNHGSSAQALRFARDTHALSHPYKTKRVETVGWSPSCKCAVGSIPCTVLDPFGGSGTVGLVADRLKRDAILIELNPKYAEMARRRIVGDAVLLADVSVHGGTV